MTFGGLFAEGERKRRLAQEHKDLILAKSLQRREFVQPSGKRRKVTQMKKKCIFLSENEKLNTQAKLCALRQPCPCI